MTEKDDGRKRAVIEGVSPEIDGGRFPVKRTVGETLAVEADIFADGHDALAAVLLYRHADEETWAEVPMHPRVNDRWSATIRAERLGTYLYTLEAWIDHFGSWRRDLEKRVEAGQDVEVPLAVGAGLLRAAAERASQEEAKVLAGLAGTLAGDAGKVSTRERLRLALDEELAQLVGRHPDRRHAVRYGCELRMTVDRERARFSSWYEMFPRSASPEVERHGTFRDLEERLPYVADMGFDVLYLPPIHPIGTTHRKGRNNATACRPGDPGSPWAIGAPEGGHTAIHPDLGTLEDFRRLVGRAGELGIEIALDIAFQCSPDHPWVEQHPEWFRRRPDGTVQYAENPPKKYEDIYPFDFETTSWRELWQALVGVFTFWIDQGVRIFRVDNPHTKPLAFWEWALAEIRGEHPEVIFLSEAFTRPKVMVRLAKLGFTQSYTYFAWRNTKWELEEYFTELTRTELAEIFRPNLWPNTPDILTEHLQFGGRPAFVQRLLLAATLGASYGIYGPAFELQENRAREAGSEEYLDSEKYQLRHWDLEREDSLRELIARVNRIRRDNPALRSDRSLTFHPVDNEHLLAYSKASEDGTNVILVVVSLDLHYRQSGWVELPLESLGLDPEQPYQVHDLLTGARFLWSGARNYVELEAHTLPAHVFRLRRRIRSERDFDYFM